jgi:hypothetical protein
MISYGYEIEEGFVLSLGDLQKILLSLSTQEHQWVAVPIPSPIWARNGERRNYVAIGYTNPKQEPERVFHRNYLAFLFPMLPLNISAANPATRENLLVCLGPKLACPLSRGLYPEDGEVMYDFLEDWDRFWYPLKQAVLGDEVPVVPPLTSSPP